MKKYYAAFLFSVIAFSGRAQVTQIATAKVMPEGSTVTIRGIVTNGAELGTIRYLQDGTAGMAAYSSSLSNVQPGDSVEITGVLDLYNNLMEINPVNNFTVISSGNPMPAPFLLTMSVGYSEIYEGRLVRFNNTQFISTGSFQTGDANYDATDGTLVSAEIRVNHLTDIAGTPIPSGSLDLVGIMSQFQSTYQLLPRDLDDFIVAGNPPVLTTSLFQFNITPASFDISFTTQNPGNSILYYGPTTSLGSVISSSTLENEHLISLTGLTPASLYYVKAASVSASGDTSFSATTPMMTQSLSSQAIKCYFTRPVDISVAQGTNAVSLPQLADDTLIAYMNRAKYTMDVAIYNMDNNNGIVDAINAAYNRGVTVRVIGDGSNLDIGTWNQLIIPSGNKKLSPTGIDYGIMHNKFVIIDAHSSDPDEAVLWTGSLNFTNQQINNDANNIVIFQDQSLAKAYEMEFNEMFGGSFGPFKQNNTPKEFNIGGSRVELFFSPSDDTESQIKRTAEASDHDLEFSVFAYTREQISYSIDERTEAGVWGGGIIDDTSNGSEVYDVLIGNMSNTLFVVNYSYIVHHKYLLTDANAPSLDPAVLTGSHNWSSSAQFDNDENTVIIHNASIANQYYQEWVARYKEAGGIELPTYNVGIHSNSTEEFSVMAFPNPAADHLHILFQSHGNDAAVIQCCDVTGKVLLEEIYPLHNGTSDFLMDISTLNDGIYILKVTTGNKEGTSKIIVSK